MKLNIKERAEKLKNDIPVIFLAMKRKDTPIMAKVLAACAVGYALSPIDLIPDFIPVIGYLDDILILPVLIAAAIKLIPENVLEKCRKDAENMWADGKPKRWYYSLPIIIVWVFIIFLLVKAFI